jgi:hypothetical protein
VQNFVFFVIKKAIRKDVNRRVRHVFAMFAMKSFAHMALSFATIAVKEAEQNA